ncbi:MULTISPECIES: AAA family ATPase [Thermodesulfobacterium]|jgi:chromosome partitioning protein|uniref:Chromosome partitioning protein ParA n=2 Tax=Thermodesulfobacterium commune TaxID=1741 RepID=A0A075WT54_9BACT|nr:MULTISPECIES: AAA family ATPase [Thermodesulfobacterium]KUJ98050.1 MAG: Cobyrinic acid ac-diamide synthase [Thermodesulfobacterium sp. 37_54]KUK19748.1 MAG: Cobyrinic acid ac-diamide synthase [Thermodesulfobacterium commune]AIH04190.1 chromosome partitioning protein ParA [Thermodesulfobacterium commune DSM 2178]KUK38518.1 MAG: Cobyrinic acid ac-diamide synthase [Thermodesulfobacterium commune]MBZ4682354.1 chromosome partitioning protein ParA [Thermodesulfobacterium sp.]
MKVLAFINQKGGVGKTTVCVNLARALTLEGFKVLVIDFDPQANASSGLGVRVKKQQSIYQAIIEEKVEPFIKQPFSGLYLLPSSIDLVGLEIELVDYPQREYVLRNLIEKGTYLQQPIKEFFDFIFIDSPPSLGLITVNILTASQGVVIPLQCEYYALEGLSLLVRTIKGIKKSLNPELMLFGLVLTMYDGRNRLSHEVAEEAEKHFKWIIFKTRIPRSVKVSEAQSFGKPVIDYDRQNRVSLAFKELSLEFLDRIRERQTLG